MITIPSIIVIALNSLDAAMGTPLGVAAQSGGATVADRERGLGVEVREMALMLGQELLEPMLEDVAEGTRGAHIDTKT